MVGGGAGPRARARHWDWDWDRSRVQGHWQAILRAGAACNALFMMQSGATLASATASTASRALLLRLLLQLRESCGSCQRFEFRSYPQKKKIEKYQMGGKRAQKVHRKSWAHVRRAQRSGHKTAILASFSGREKPFLFRKKVLMVGGSDLVSLSGSHSGCKPCELPKNTADTNSAGNCTRGAQKFSQII